MYLRGGGSLQKAPEATGPPCRVERLVETKQVLAFEDKVDVVGKAEDKEG